MSQKSFHEAWVAAFVGLLEVTAQKHRLTNGPRGNAYSELAAFAMQQNLRAATDNYAMRIIEHHWLTRFYQRLSAVSLLTEMIDIGWRQLARSAAPTCYFPPLLQVGHDEQESWQSGWRQADRERLREMALVSVRSVCEWATQQAPEFLAPGEAIVVELIGDLLRQILVPISSLTNPAGQIVNRTAWLSMYQAYEELKKQLTILINFPDPWIVADAHDHARMLQCEMQVAGQACAAARTTCRSMAATLSESWARLKLLFIMPDMPGCHGQRPGTGYHQGRAWQLLEYQLRILTSGHSTQPSTTPIVCWSNMCTCKGH